MRRSKGNKRTHVPESAIERITYPRRMIFLGGRLSPRRQLDGATVIVIER